MIISKTVMIKRDLRLSQLS